MRPLREEIRDLVASTGPVTVERYMGLCLERYYGSRDPFGRGGDFITAPEISQMFGELIGLWAATVWQADGKQDPLRLIELGPGRGTLIADALRAARRVPGFAQAVRLDLVETSPSLMELQRRTLGACGIPAVWHAALEDVPGGPAIILANEFFDALPIRQFVGTAHGWCERLVGETADGLRFCLASEPETSIKLPVRIGACLEQPASAERAMLELARRLVCEGGAALIVDYGYWGPALGDTLQAVRAHRFADPLLEPGEADLTAQVPFHRLAAAAANAGAAIHGPVAQGDFLRALGIEARAAALSAHASPAEGEKVASALHRLIGPQGMGRLFKVLAISHPGVETLPGLPRNPLPSPLETQ